MASAMKNTKTVEIITGYTLELSVDEAQTIMDIVGGYIIGDSNLTVRKHTDSVYEALEKLGVVARNTGFEIEGNKLLAVRRLK